LQRKAHIHMYIPTVYTCIAHNPPQKNKGFYKASLLGKSEEEENAWKTTKSLRTIYNPSHVAFLSPFSRVKKSGFKRLHIAASLPPPSTL